MASETFEQAELHIRVDNDDDGGHYEIKAHPEALVRSAVDKLYKDHLHRDRLPGDRLRCNGNGDDVFAHLEEHLEAYKRTQCHRLEWDFAADQGGA